MSKSTHQIAVKATDQTAGAFASIQTRAAAASAKLRSMLGGAMAAAGAYFGFRSIAGAINELGTLSDIAQKSSLSVEELTKSATALNVLGVQNMGVEQFAKAFQMMEKNTGRTGMEGFHQTIQEIGKIPDLSERAQAAMAVFGRSGMEFMPLINAADTGTEALQRVIEAMPGIPQAAADAGDKLNDAKAIGVQGFKKLWLEAIGSVSRSLDTQFKGGVREAALTGVAYMEYFVKSSWARVVGFFSACGLVFEGFDSSLTKMARSFSRYVWDVGKTLLVFVREVGEETTAWFGDNAGSFIYKVGEALKALGVPVDVIKSLLDKSGISDFVFGRNIENWRPGGKKADFRRPWEKLEEGFNESTQSFLSGIDFDAIGALMNSTEDYIRELDRKLKEAKNKAGVVEQAIAAAVESSGSRTGNGNKPGDLLGGKMKSRIVNELIMGGSNRSFNLAMIGPQMSNELKKANDYLRKIVDNTKEGKERYVNAGKFEVLDS